MTNYNERLDEILAKHGAEPGEMAHSLKQALTSLTRELVAEAKPKDYPVCEDNPNPSNSSWCNKCWTCRARDNYELWSGIEIGIEKFEQNLLKALGEI